MRVMVCTIFLAYVLTGSSNQTASDLVVKSYLDHSRSTRIRTDPATFSRFNGGEGSLETPASCTDSPTLILASVFQHKTGETSSLWSLICRSLPVSPLVDSQEKRQ
jgi:hypothetical protein